MNESGNKKLVAGWSLTSRCNLDCMHCYNRSGCADPDELSFEEAIAVADKLKAAGVAAVNFGGGECALRKEFIDICQYLKSHDIKISYTTNGTVSKILMPNLKLFSDIGVSIDFPDREKHDWFRGRKGTYEQAINLIKSLVNAGMDTEIVTCLTRMNCSPEYLQKFMDLAKNLGVNYWRINRFRNTGRGIDNSSELALTPELLHNAYGWLSKYINQSTNIPEPLFRAAYGGDIL